MALMVTVTMLAMALRDKSLEDHVHSLHQMTLWSAWLICSSVEVEAVVTTLLPRLGQATWAPLGA